MLVKDSETRLQEANTLPRHQQDGWAGRGGEVAPRRLAHRQARARVAPQRCDEQSEPCPKRRRAPSRGESAEVVQVIRLHLAQGGAMFIFAPPCARLPSCELWLL